MVPNRPAGSDGAPPSTLSRLRPENLSYSSRVAGKLILSLESHRLRAFLHARYPLRYSAFVARHLLVTKHVLSPLL